MDPNPFAVLSFIVAPAILTNASSVLAMSTSNRLARAVDRARELSKQLEESSDFRTPEATRRFRELSAAELRSLLILTALRSFYIGMGCFASTTLVSLIGAVMVQLNAQFVAHVFVFIGVLTGLSGVSALGYGSLSLVRETRIAVRVLQERAANIRARAAPKSEVIESDESP